MLDIGFSELLVFGIIALLVLGPEKLPEAARFAAKWYSKFKRAISSVQNDIDRELRLSEFREEMQQEMLRIQELEQKMQSQMQALQQQSLLAVEKEQHTASSQNKNSPVIYNFMHSTVPSLYFSKIWVKKHNCSYEQLHIVPSESRIMPELKVAV